MASNSKKKESNMVNITDTVTCHECRTVPREADIIQCLNSHVICKTCFDGAEQQNCPECRVHLCATNLNRVAMQVRDTYVDFNCKYQEEGCHVRDKKADLEKHERNCPYRADLCPYHSKGCQEEVSFSRMEQHTKGCLYQKINCLMRRCKFKADITVKGLPQHMKDKHRFVPILPGGGQHEAFFKLDPVDLQDVPPEEGAYCAPICCQFDKEHFFYLHLSRFKSGRWIAYVYSNGTRKDGFIATVEAVTNKDQVIMSYKGPVNPFDMSRSAESEGENIFGLTINNTIVRDELIKTEGEDENMVEIRVKVENVDVEVNRKAEEEMKEVQPQMEAQLREAEQAAEELNRKSDEEEEAPPPKKRARRSKGSGMIMCIINDCGKFFEDRTKFRNHLSDHFADQMLAILMAEQPTDKNSQLICPVPNCKKTQRDKINLRRHYAFGHKKIDDYCTREQQEGVFVSMGESIAITSQVWSEEDRENDPVVKRDHQEANNEQQIEYF